MPPPLELAIPSFTTSPTPKPHTIYGVSVRQPLRSYTLQKRYTDFTTLHDLLTLQTGAPPPLPLPPKSWLKSTVSDLSYAEERRKALEMYLRALNDAADTRWRESAAWRTFLNLPASAGNARGGVSSTAGRITGLHATITDPNVWLDVHRDLKSQLRDARQAVARREQVTATQAQHKAAADAKGCLVRAQAMITALEGGLESMSGSPHGSANGNNNKTGGKKTIFADDDDDDDDDDDRPSSRLGEGELRRRKDLLASTKKERDHITDLLSAQVSRQNDIDAASPTSPASADKSMLLQPSARNGIRTGRVLGAAKETEETRQLDNEGVVQLQKQKMQEQDEDVAVLTGTVARLKEMGVQVNNELELQNEMLGVLDKDVGRMQEKVDVGKKRIGRIK